MPLPPILTGLLWLLLRPWPHWLQDRIFEVQTSYHRDATPCRDRWCQARQDRSHW